MFNNVEKCSTKSQITISNSFVELIIPISAKKGEFFLKACIKQCPFASRLFIVKDMFLCQYTRLAPVLKTIFINVSYHILVASLTLMALV